MSPINLVTVLKGYDNKWVALSDDKTTVYSAGATAKEAVQGAEKRGKRDFTLLFVEPSDVQYCG